MIPADEIGLRLDETTAIAQAACDLAAAGDLEGARKLFEGLTELDPDDASAWAALGTVFQKLGMPADAERAYGEAIRSEPEHPVALGNLGEMRLARGEAAGEELLRRASRGPDSLAAVVRAKSLLQARRGQSVSAR